MVNRAGFHARPFCLSPEFVERSIGPDHLNGEISEQVGMILEAYESKAGGKAFMEEPILIKSASQARAHRQASQSLDSVLIAGVEVGYDDSAFRTQNTMAFPENSCAVSEERNGAFQEHALKRFVCKRERMRIASEERKSLVPSPAPGHQQGG
jgi:hypothetical protein